MDIDIDAIETFEIVQTGTGTTSNNDGDCNTINILQTSTAELTEGNVLTNKIKITMTIVYYVDNDLF